MADAEREARINLTTVADGTGAQQTAKDIGNVEKATLSLEKASKESQKTTEELTTSKKGFRETMKGVALELPGVARAVTLLTNPLTALGVVLGTVGTAFLHWKASIDQMANTKRTFETINDEIDSLERKLKNFRAQGAQSGEFGMIKSGAEAATASVARLNDEMEASRLLQDALSDKGLTLTNARIDAQVKAGKLTRSQGVQAKVDAADQVRRDKEAREIGVAETRLKNLQDTLGGLPNLTIEDLAKLEREADASARASGKAKDKFDAVKKRNAGLMEEIGQGGTATSVLAEAFGSGDIKESASVKTINRLGSQVEEERAKFRASQLAADEAKRRLESAKTTVAKRQGLVEQIDKGQKDLAVRKSFLSASGPLDRAIGEASVEDARKEEQQEQIRNLLDLYYNLIEEADRMPPAQRRRRLESLNPRGSVPKKGPAPYPRINPQPPHPAYPPDRPGSPGSRRGVDDDGTNAAADLASVGGQANSQLAELLQLSTHMFEDLHLIAKKHEEHLRRLEGRISDTQASI
jgi:hypothetical protein